MTAYEMALEAALITADKERVESLERELGTAQRALEIVQYKLQIARAGQEANLRMMRAERGME